MTSSLPLPPPLSLLLSLLLMWLVGNAVAQSGGAADEQFSAHKVKCYPLRSELCPFYNFTVIQPGPSRIRSEKKILQYFELIKRKCSPQIRFFICALYYPICLVKFGTSLQPCQSMCTRATLDCRTHLETLDLTLPDCSDFPVHPKVVCMQPNSSSSMAPSTPVTLSSPRPVVAAGQTHRSSSANKSIHPLLMLTSTTQTSFGSSASPSSSDSASFSSSSSWLSGNTKLNAMLKAEKKLAREVFKERFGDLSDAAKKSVSCSCQCGHPFVPVVFWTNRENRGSPGAPADTSDTAPTVSSMSEISSSGIPYCAQPCYSPYFKINHDQAFVNLWIGVWAALCLLSSLLILLTFVIDTDRFKYPERSIIYLSICFFMISVGYVIRLAAGHERIACQKLSLAWPQQQTPQQQLQQPFSSASSSSFLSPVVSRLLAAVKQSSTSSSSSILTTQIIRYQSRGPALCAIVFLIIYFFNMAAAIWWVLLMFTWFLSATLKWGSEAIAKYAQMYHFVAWLLPAIKTIVIIVIRGVDGDSILGICTVGHTNPLLFVVFQLAPAVLYLSLGTVFLLAGFVALFRIRRVLKAQTGGQGPEKLEKLMMRIGVFSVLYIVPALVLIVCQVYELRHKPRWNKQLLCSCNSTKSSSISGSTSGSDERSFSSSTAASQNGMRNSNDVTSGAQQPEYALFMIKYFMSVVVGITSGFWIWSGKTVYSWRKLFFALRLTKKPPKSYNTIKNTQLHHIQLRKKPNNEPLVMTQSFGGRTDVALAFDKARHVCEESGGVAGAASRSDVQQRLVHCATSSGPHKMGAQSVRSGQSSSGIGMACAASPDGGCATAASTAIVSSEGVIPLITLDSHFSITPATAMLSTAATNCHGRAASPRSASLHHHPQPVSASCATTVRRGEGDREGGGSSSTSSMTSSCSPHQQPKSQSAHTTPAAPHANTHGLHHLATPTAPALRNQLAVSRLAAAPPNGYLMAANNPLSVLPAHTTPGGALHNQFAAPAPSSTVLVNLTSNAIAIDSASQSSNSTALFSNSQQLAI